MSDAPALAGLQLHLLSDLSQMTSLQLETTCLNTRWTIPISTISFRSRFIVPAMPTALYVLESVDRLILALSDGSLSEWSFEGHQLRKSDTTATPDPIWSLSRFDNTLYAGTALGHLQVWSLDLLSRTSSKLIKEYSAEAVRVAATERFLVTADDEMIRSWDRHSMTQIAHYESRSVSTNTLCLAGGIAVCGITDELGSNFQSALVVLAIPSMVLLKKEELGDKNVRGVKGVRSSWSLSQSMVHTLDHMGP